MKKTALVLATVGALGASAVAAPTPAEAHWRGGFGFYAPIVYGGSSCYIVRRVVETPYGARVRRVEVCD